MMAFQIYTYNLVIFIWILRVCTYYMCIIIIIIIIITNLRENMLSSHLMNMLQWAQQLFVQLFLRDLSI